MVNRNLLYSKNSALNRRNFTLLRRSVDDGLVARQTAVGGWLTAACGPYRGGGWQMVGPTWIGRREAGVGGLQKGLFTVGCDLCDHRIFFSTAICFTL